VIESFGEAQAVLDRITFGLPGWSLRLLDRGPYLLDLVLVAKVPDTYQPDRIVAVHHAGPLPLPMPEQAFIHQVRHRIHQAVCHEADEWILVDGDRVFDPHR
jgi:hypothetical protein